MEKSVKKVVVSDAVSPAKGRKENCGPATGTRSRSGSSGSKGSSRNKSGSAEDLKDRSRSGSRESREKRWKELDRSRESMVTDDDCELFDCEAIEEVGIKLFGPYSTEAEIDSQVRQMKRPLPTADSGDVPGGDEAAGPSTPKAPKEAPKEKRGPGRPIKTGEYSRLAEEKERLLVAERQQVAVMAEKACYERIFAARGRREARAKDPGLPGDDQKLSAHLSDTILECVSNIEYISKHSGNLKGGFQGGLYEAADVIRSATRELAKRTISEENALLKAAYDRQSQKIAELEASFAQLRVDFEGKALDPVLSQEELSRSIMTQVNRMIGARFEAMEERLLPETRLRPPLAADKKKAAKVAEARVPAAAPQPKAAHLKMNKPAKSSAANEKSASQPTAPAASWSDVVKRGKKARPASQPVKPVSQAPASQETNKKSRKRKRKVRAPERAAVVITVPQEAVQQGLTYDKVLEQARQSVKLQELGIPGLNFRAGVTGSRVLEVLGKESAEGADRLVTKLREVLPDSVRVVRPIKQVSIRLSGLDDSVSKQDILDAVVQSGKCLADHIRVGEIRVGLFGAGSVIIQCPVASGHAILDGGRLLVGWSSARVHALEPRPFKCFKCLELGHVAAQCTTGVDRSVLCFRCGQPGHKVAMCTAQPHCPACEAKKRPAGHQIGSKKCIRPKKRSLAAIRTQAAARLGQGRPVEGAMVTD